MTSYSSWALEVYPFGENPISLSAVPSSTFIIRRTGFRLDKFHTDYPDCWVIESGSNVYTIFPSLPMVEQLKLKFKEGYSLYDLPVFYNITLSLSNNNYILVFTDV